MTATTTIKVNLTTDMLADLREGKYQQPMTAKERDKIMFNPTTLAFIKMLQLQYVTDKTLIALEGATQDNIATFMYKQHEIDTSIALLTHLLEMHLTTTTNSTTSENTHEN